MDLHLPDGNGIDFLWDLRNWEEERGIVGEDGVPVIVITADEDLHLFHEAHVMGCISYLIKPIQREKFISELKRFSLI